MRRAILSLDCVPACSDGTRRACRRLPGASIERVLGGFAFAVDEHFPRLPPKEPISVRVKVHLNRCIAIVSPEVESPSWLVLVGPHHLPYPRRKDDVGRAKCRLRCRVGTRGDQWRDRGLGLLRLPQLLDANPGELVVERAAEARPEGLQGGNA